MADTVRLSTSARRMALCEEAAHRARGASAETARVARDRRSVAAEAEGQPRSACRISSTISKRWKPAASTATADAVITRPAPRDHPVGRQGRRRAYGLRPRLRRSRRDRRGSSAWRSSCRSNAFTCGALGYFAGRLAERRAGGDRRHQRAGAACRRRVGTKPVYCTNPMAFAAPVAGGAAAGHRPVVERHRLRQHPQAAARRPRAIPAGWALDARRQADHRSGTRR